MFDNKNELEAREEFQKVFSIESIRDLVKRRIRRNSCNGR